MSVCAWVLLVRGRGGPLHGASCRARVHHERRSRRLIFQRASSLTGVRSPQSYRAERRGPQSGSRLIRAGPLRQAGAALRPAAAREQDFRSIAGGDVWWFASTVRRQRSDWIPGAACRGRARTAGSRDPPPSPVPPGPPSRRPCGRPPGTQSSVRPRDHVGSSTHAVRQGRSQPVPAGWSQGQPGEPRVGGLDVPPPGHHLRARAQHQAGGRLRVHAGDEGRHPAPVQGHRHLPDHAIPAPRPVCSTSAPASVSGRSPRC